MSQILFTKTLENGNTINVYQDEYSESPREWTRFGEIAYKGNGRYVLGDTAVSQETLQELAEDSNILSIPVYAYIHGETRLTASESGNPYHCPWDSGRCGLIWVTLDKVVTEFGNRSKTNVRKAKDLLIQEVKTFNQWLNGGVYSYVVTDPEGNTVDSLSGIYADSPGQVAAQFEAGEF